MQIGDKLNFGKPARRSEEEGGAQPRRQNALFVTNKTN
jgi:hypothetical protein